MLPIFVADRPYQLATLHEVADRPFGVLTTPKISNAVQTLYRNYPAKERWGDNGIFVGIRLSPQQLLAWYHSLNLTHGLILDIFKEKDATLEFAEQMWGLYKQKKYCFELVGVAQGNTADEYVGCVKNLLSLGFESIAIGGLLTLWGVKKHTLRRIDMKMVSNILRLLHKEGISVPRLHWLGCLKHDRLLEDSADSHGWCRDWINRSYSRSMPAMEARKRYLQETYFNKSQMELW